MNTTAKLDSAGRLMVPRQVRKELGLTPASELILRVEDGGFRVETREAALQRVQAYIKKVGKSDGNVVDQFLKERRKEVRREAAEMKR